MTIVSTLERGKYSSSLFLYLCPVDIGLGVERTYISFTSLSRPFGFSQKPRIEVWAQKSDWMFENPGFRRLGFF